MGLGEFYGRNIWDVRNGRVSGMERVRTCWWIVHFGSCLDTGDRGHRGIQLVFGRLGLYSRRRCVSFFRSAAIWNGQNTLQM